MGVGQFAIADLDHDGVTDLAFGGIATNNILFVLGKKPDGSLGIKQSIMRRGPLLPNYNNGLARVLAWHRSPEDQIVTVNTTGTARIYAGNPLSELDSFPVESDAVSAAIGDVDANGADDLLVLPPGRVYAYSLNDGSTRMERAHRQRERYSARATRRDPALEIVIAGPQPGLVLDGAHPRQRLVLYRWVWRNARNRCLQLRRRHQVVAAQRWNQSTVFRSEPWSPLWSAASNYEVGAVATGDIDGYGIDSILYGDGQSGEVHVIDPATHRSAFQFPTQAMGCKLSLLEISTVMVRLKLPSPQVHRDLTKLLSQSPAPRRVRHFGHSPR